jgi:hypothetical protein
MGTGEVRVVCEEYKRKERSSKRNRKKVDVDGDQCVECSDMHSLKRNGCTWRITPHCSVTHCTILRYNALDSCAVLCCAILCYAYLSGDTVQSFLQSVPHSCGLSDGLRLCNLLLLRPRRGSDGRRREKGGREVGVRRKWW